MYICSETDLVEKDKTLQAGRNTCAGTERSFQKEEKCILL